ncbi:MAG TPA: ABC transporter ATP-binding protein [Steroidobacteraceae bacterium]|nr:ABC transporter ATP-binding protein [Steroidobacteraceae bacterium]
MGGGCGGHGSGMKGAILQVRNLNKAYPMKTGLLEEVFAWKREAAVRAVDDVSFDVSAGEVLGIIGESGCGKTTTGFAVLRLIEPSSGGVRFNGDPVPSGGKGMLRFRRQAQIIFQDPYQSLNPRFTVFDTVAEPLSIHGLARGNMRAQVLDTLDQVGLRPPASFLHRFPHELSGGQRQRVAIARAMVLRPQLLIADEPVSMLDVSVRAGILRLLRSLSRDAGLSVIYISHDISTVRYLCDRTAVMYLGRIVEIGSTDAVLHTPKHPYTAALLAAVPRIAPRACRPRVSLGGDVPSSAKRPSGCVFHPRCPRVFDPCATTVPRKLSVDNDHEVACHLYDGSGRSPQ